MIRKGTVPEGAGERARQDADKSDADLDGREKPSGLLRQLQGEGGAPAVDHRLQAGLAGRYDGEFRQGKETVQEDQKEGYAKFQHGAFWRARHHSKVVDIAAAGLRSESVIR